MRPIFYRVIFMAAGIFLLAGCNTYKIKNFERYQVTNLPQSAAGQQLRSDNRAKVVISVDDQDIELAKRVNIASFILGQLEKTFVNLKYVIVLDRNISKKITDEIIRAEMAGDGHKVTANFTTNPDYIILCKLHHVEFSNSYDDNSETKVGMAIGKLALMAGAAYALSDGGHRGSVMVDASPNPDIRGTYTYTATVSGSFKIIQLPSFEEVETIPFENIATKKEDDNNDTAKELDKQLLLDAATNAVNASMVKILQYIKPTGHIIERKDVDIKNPSIFKLSFGAKDGIVEGNEILLKKITYEYNPITKKNQIEQIDYIKLGYATKITINSSWVMVKDKNIASTLKFGDEVTVAVRKLKN